MNYYIEFDFINAGTIPLHIVRVVVDSPPEITVKMPWGWECRQLHPNEKLSGTIVLGAEQSAKECTAYTFTVTVEVVQWNMYTP